MSDIFRGEPKKGYNSPNYSDNITRQGHYLLMAY